MSKDPAVLFYTSDFISGTYTMTDTHVGMYIRLLCLQHQKGALTEQDMLYICKTYVEDVYCKFDKNGDGLYRNKRMDIEIRKRTAYCESRRENVSKGHKKRSTYVEHMENENENRNRVINKDKNKKDFIEMLRENPAYKHIDIDQELCKMDAWLSAHPGRKKTKRFVLNWLNKIEKPLPESPISIEEQNMRNFQKSLEESNAKRFTR